jgi:hypothetical protein
MRSSSASSAQSVVAVVLILVGGSVALAGAVFAIAGGYLCAFERSCLSGHPGGLPLLIIGAGIAYLGVSLVNWGARKRENDHR